MSLLQADFLVDAAVGRAVERAGIALFVSAPSLAKARRFISMSMPRSEVSIGIPEP